MFSLFAAAWCGHTDSSREIADDIKGALSDCRWKHDYAAGLMGISEHQLCRQLAGNEPLNTWRLGFLPMEFHVALCRRRMARIGAEVITAEQRDLILGAAIVGVKKMAKIGLSIIGLDDERQVS